MRRASPWQPRDSGSNTNRQKHHGAPLRSASAKTEHGSRPCAMNLDEFQLRLTLRRVHFETSAAFSPLTFSPHPSPMQVMCFEVSLGRHLKTDGVDGWRAAIPSRRKKEEEIARSYPGSIVNYILPGIGGGGGGRVYPFVRTVAPPVVRLQRFAHN